MMYQIIIWFVVRTVVRPQENPDLEHSGRVAARGDGRGSERHSRAARILSWLSFITICEQSLSAPSMYCMLITLGKYTRQQQTQHGVARTCRERRRKWTKKVKQSSTWEFIACGIGRGHHCSLRAVCLRYSNYTARVCFCSSMHI
jgi:hypothetical protein